MEIFAIVIMIFALMLGSAALGVFISYKILESKEPPRIEIQIPPIEIKQASTAAPTQEGYEKRQESYKKQIEDYFKHMEQERERAEKSEPAASKEFHDIHGVAQRVYDEFLAGEVDSGGENEDG